MARNTVGRAFGSFHPASMPRLSRALYRRELLAWLFLPVMMGAVEGAVTSVIALNTFGGVVPGGWLKFAVAILSGAPALANITSFLWASISHGRHKIRFLTGLQIAAVVLIAQFALAPPNELGLVMLLIAAVGARICWSGVVTLRSTVWRANFPRNVRANMAGKLATVQAIMLGGVGFAIALSMRSHADSYRLIYPLAAGAGFIGSVIYSRMRVRGHAAMLSAETRDNERTAPRINPLQMARIFRDNPMFRRYMSAMFVFGMGNLAINAPLVIVLDEVFGYEYLEPILIVGTIPIILMPLTIPFWSRLLDRVHIVRFRMFHSWSFVATTVMILLGAVLVSPAFLWIGALLKGVAVGGGVLGWNLGHHDFAPPELTSQYMGVHVTLTGIRGFIAPIGAVWLYELFNVWQPGKGGWVFAVCLALNLIGAGMFIALNRRMRKSGTDLPVDG